MACSGCATCVDAADCFRATAGGRRFEKVMKFGGTFAFLVGSVCFAFTTWAGSVPWIFALFFLGHGCWLAAGVIMKDRGTVMLNSMYLLFDALACALRL